MTINTLSHGTELGFRPVDVVVAHGDEWAKRQIEIDLVLGALENMAKRPLRDTEELDIIQVMNDRINPPRRGES